MSPRVLISLALVTTLGMACVSTDALAWRGGAYRGGVAVRGGVYRGGAVAVRGGAYRGGAVAWRGGYYRGGLGVGAAAVGAAAIGTAAAASYYNRPACGYYPYPPCY
jgi:hypothetical protein